MQRPTLLAAAAAFIAAVALTSTAPAEAAPAQPSPPSQVAVTGQDDSATVTWAAGSAVRRAHVTGYTIAISPAGKHRHHRFETVGPRTFSARFGHLAPATTYTFTVRAKSGRTLSTPVSVQYTRPTTPPARTESLYAVDGSGNLVRRPVSGGAWTTIAPNGAGYAVDASGTAYVIGTDHRSIIAYPETGGSTVVASGLSSGVSTLDADDAGDLFFTQDWTVVELPHGSSTIRTVGAGYATAVGPTGVVAAQVKGPDLLVYPPAGTSYRIEAGPASYLSAFGVDAAGNVYLNNRSTGASGYATDGVVPAGTSDYTALVTPDAAVALAHDGDLSALQTAAWCNRPAENDGSCVPDTRVPVLWQRTAAGAVTTKPISGLDIGSVRSAAADTAGDVFVAVADGPSAGLVRVPSTGGAVEQLDTATYRELSVH